MLGTLRFRLTALFLAVVLVFGLVSIAARRPSLPGRDPCGVDPRARARGLGLAALYAESALRSTDEGAKAPEFAAENLELATGDELFYVGAPCSRDSGSASTRLSRSALGDVELDRDRQVTFEFTPPGRSQAARVRAAGATRARDRAVRLARRRQADCGVARAVADPRGEARARSRRRRRSRRRALFWWLSRRLTEPVLALTRATEDVAAGRYDVEIPDARGSDEISLLTERFRRDG